MRRWRGGRITVTSSTQIPHIIRRIVGQALGIPWGKVRIVKPYIGGGFGNKRRTALYEPLCAFLCTQVGGRLVKLDVSREETFVCNRVRHAIRSHIITYVRPDGTFVGAAAGGVFPSRGAYASHGHGIVAKGGGRRSASCTRARGVQGGRLHGVYEHAGGRRHAWLRHPAGDVRARVPH